LLDVPSQERLAYFSVSYYGADEQFRRHRTQRHRDAHRDKGLVLSSNKKEREIRRRSFYEPLVRPVYDNNPRRAFRAPKLTPGDECQVAV
jgi:hypothetical protein